MKNKKDTISDLDIKLQELKETARREKVDLTTEVEQYLQKHAAEIEKKIVSGKKVLQKDIHFVKEVRLWIETPPEWRDKYPIGQLSQSEEAREAKKRHLAVHQWYYMLQVAANMRQKTRFDPLITDQKKWIDENFQFPGNRKIHTKIALRLWKSPLKKLLPKGLSTEGIIDLQSSKELTELPEGLKVDKNIICSSCTSLEKLPRDLEVGNTLYLGECSSLEEIPKGIKARGIVAPKCTSLRKLPDDLKLKRNLALNHCTALTSLPKGLNVSFLSIEGCTSLTSLPDDLVVTSINLSKDLHPQVIADAMKKVDPIRIMYIENYNG